MAYFSESDRAYALDKIAELGQENAKLRELVEGMLDLLRLGLVSGEGISKRWCRDRWEHYRDRYRELEAEVTA